MPRKATPRSAVRSLARKGEEAARLLAELGTPRSVARVLVFLSRAGEATSSEIASGTGLRQPEVSVATAMLRREGLAKKRDVKRKGKGRPLHVYNLTASLADVVTDIESRKRQEMEETSSNLSRLRALVERQAPATSPMPGEATPAREPLAAGATGSSSS